MEIKLQNKAVIEQFRYWSWFHVLYLYDDSHLLIADEAFIDFVRKSRKDVFRCKTARPTGYVDSVTPDIKKILVFTKTGERAIVRSLQERFPDVLVTSGTYGFACTGKDRYPRLFEYSSKRPKKNIRPTIFLSTPYADAEFVIKALAERGMPFAPEHLARPFVSWLGVQQGFQISRFYKEMEHRFSKNGQLYTLVQTDVLNSLLKILLLHSIAS